MPIICTVPYDSLLDGRLQYQCCFQISTAPIGISTTPMNFIRPSRLRVLSRRARPCDRRPAPQRSGGWRSSQPRHGSAAPRSGRHQEAAGFTIAALLRNGPRFARDEGFVRLGTAVSTTASADLVTRAELDNIVLHKVVGRRFAPPPSRQQRSFCAETSVSLSMVRLARSCCTMPMRVYKRDCPEIPYSARNARAPA